MRKNLKAGLMESETPKSGHPVANSRTSHINSERHEKVAKIGKKGCSSICESTNMPYLTCLGAVRKFCLTAPSAYSHFLPSNSSVCRNGTVRHFSKSLHGTVESANFWCSLSLDFFPWCSENAFIETEQY